MSAWPFVVDFQEMLLLSLLNGFQLVPRVFDQIHGVDIYYVRLRHLKWSVVWNLKCLLIFWCLLRWIVFMWLLQVSTCCTFEIVFWIVCSRSFTPSVDRLLNMIFKLILVIFLLLFYTIYICNYYEAYTLLSLKYFPCFILTQLRLNGEIYERKSIWPNKQLEGSMLLSCVKRMSLLVKKMGWWSTIKPPRWGIDSKKG